MSTPTHRALFSTALETLDSIERRASLPAAAIIDAANSPERSDPARLMIGGHRASRAVLDLIDSSATG